MNRLRQLVTKFRLWFDTAATPARPSPGVHHVDWVRVLPFVGMHLACLGVIWVAAHGDSIHRAAGDQEPG
jgi:stearoyl-CoA desaturase (delta-9 desaturase)